MTSDEPGASPPSQYDAFADDFAVHAESSAYNAFCDRPAMLTLAGDVAGLRVLDAGCGPGLYAEELLAGGAQVTAFDESAEMVRLARQRLGTDADVRIARLSEPLSWLPDDSQDLVILALVLHHLDDRVGALRELHRVLAPGERLLLSTTHPTSDWLLKGGSYFDTSCSRTPGSAGGTCGGGANPSSAGAPSSPKPASSSSASSSPNRPPRWPPTTQTSTRSSAPNPASSSSSSPSADTAPARDDNRAWLDSAADE